MGQKSRQKRLRRRLKSQVVRMRERMPTRMTWLAPLTEEGLDRRSLELAEKVTAVGEGSGK